MVAPPLSSTTLRRQRGASMIEVLVTIVIVAFGLLGLAGLQMRLQSSEMESYQRSQALLLLNDMANRIATNRDNASTAAYVAGATVASPLGAGMTCSTATTTLVERDLREWCNALQGAAEMSGSSKVGAMIGGRGCVQKTAGNDYLVTVAWQGLTPLSDATDTSLCGGGTTYDGVSGSLCTDNRCRRAVTTVVKIATLANP